MTFATIALEKLASKGILTTALSSAELRDMDRAILDRSIFSARTTNATYVQATKDSLQRLMSGETNEATERATLQDLLDSLDYNPERGGFIGDQGVPPAERGSLRDLSSNERVKFVLDTNESQVANYGTWKAGNEDLARWQFPCWELVRIYPRSTPRGFQRTKVGLMDLPGASWEERWQKAGGTLVDGRMIARKDDPIWTQLGNSDLFPDGLNTPYPPFAFGSGMGWREVPRDESIALGLIGPDETPDFQEAGLNDELKAAADQFDPEILAALRDDLTEQAGELRTA